MQIDKSLIQRCLKNDRSAQRELYDQIMPYLNVICRRYLYQESELSDVLQESLIKIFKNLKTFDPYKAKFKTWATKIAINCCLSANEKQSKRKTQELVVPTHEVPVSPQALQSLSDEELLRLIKLMPATYQQVFNLAAVEEFSHAEIAEILGISEALSRKRLTRSRAWLKERLPNNLKVQYQRYYN
ncbi:MAG: RNA polymerase sigma factor [Bacteroidota bacterium]